jgi:hypothetical protein
VLDFVGQLVGSTGDSDSGRCGVEGFGHGLSGVLDCV